MEAWQACFYRGYFWLETDRTPFFMIFGAVLQNNLEWDVGIPWVVTHAVRKAALNTSIFLLKLPTQHSPRIWLTLCLLRSCHGSYFFNVSAFVLFCVLLLHICSHRKFFFLLLHKRMIQYTVYSLLTKHPQRAFDFTSNLMPLWSPVWGKASH